MTGGCLGDNTVAAYLSRRLTPAEQREADEHIDTCATCRRHLSDLADSQVPLATTEPLSSERERGDELMDLPAGATIGRYVIVERLGEGGMGIVYRAKDPELGRDVALKMVRGATPKLEGRLLREAQAMARLSHRNVVAVYDRIVHADRLFIAMELIAGASLATWLRKERSMKEKLDTFLEAGSGLVAAHAAGVIHRDFKPDNVLIDEAKHRVCVTDLGLARWTGEPPSQSDVARALSKDATELAATKSGTIMGTPAYMAPEQYSGEADAQTDQFAFCVALHEALYGAPPFEGDTVATRIAAVLSGRFRPLPSGSDVPKRIHRLLVRGMHPERSKRHPSMAVLLQALRREERRPARRVVLAVAAVAAVAALAPLAVGAAALRARSASSQASIAHSDALVCSRPEVRLAGVWDAARRADVEKAFLATQKPYAADGWHATERAMDAYTKEWATVYVEACTSARGGEGAARLRQLACLDERRVELRSLADAFTHADAALVGRAASAAQSLTRVAHCRGDPSTMTRLRTPPPPDAATLPKVLAVRQELGKIRALQTAQRWKEMWPLAAPAVEAARATGYRPVIGEALCWAGAAYAWTRDDDKTIGAYREAATIAEAVSDDRVRIGALIGLLNATETAGRSDLASEHERQLVAIAEGLPNDDEIQFRLQFAIGVTYLRRGETGSAVTALRKSMKASERTFGRESWNTSYMIASLALALGLDGQADEAAALNEESLRIQLATVGPENPAIFVTHTTTALALLEVLRSAEAETHLREALRIAERELGPKDATTADLLDYLGRALADQGRPSLALHERALAIREEVLPADHQDFIYSLAGLGRAHLLANAPQKAIPPLERALKVHAPEKAKELAEVELLLAQAIQKRDRARARQLATHSRDVSLKAPKVPRRDRDLAALERLLSTRE